MTRVWRVKLWITGKADPFSKVYYFSGKNFGEVWEKAQKEWSGYDKELMSAELLGELT